jgi:UrcA family protein
MHRRSGADSVSAVLENPLGEPQMNASIPKSNHPFSSFALLAVCLLGTTIASADPPPATRSVEVSFRDLDLNTASGTAKLYRRIQAAARSVCQYEPTSPREQSIWQYCVRPAVDAAVAKVNNPLLTQLHSGHSSPAVTALNK